MKKNILLVKGGGGTEHDISLVSSKYLKSNIDTSLYNVIDILIDKDFTWRDENLNIVELNFNKELIGPNFKIKIDAAIPCIHGYPGETGDIQSYFEMIKLPYIGCGSEASKLAFNKISTKLWFKDLGIPNTPFMLCSDESIETLNNAASFFDEHKNIFIKASNQGSSVGCYPVTKKEDVEHFLKEAFKFSPYVLIEKTVNARELEVSVFEFNGEIKTTVPGEINCPSKFYSFEEKYNQHSKTTTSIVAENVPEQISSKIREYAHKAFSSLKLRHLSRIDFFLCDDGNIYLNEINTFPGMTPISMFPKMMENSGVKFYDFINYSLKDILK